jgi:hypothetical protein
MECDMADTLLDNYAKATLEYFDAAETILAFVGSHTQFQQARLRAKQKRGKCKTARLALEAHLEHHNCGLSSLETSNP